MGSGEFNRRTRVKSLLVICTSLPFLYVALSHFVLHLTMVGTRNPPPAVLRLSLEIHR